MADGDGLLIRAQRLTGPNFPRTNSPSSSQAERVEELGAVQLAWAYLESSHRTAARRQEIFAAIRRASSRP